MIATLIKEEEVYETILPDKIIGKYWLCDTYNNKIRELISIEPINGKWNLISSTKAKILSANKIRENVVELKPMALYELNIIGEYSSAYVYCEEADDKRQSFTKLYVQDGSAISFGNYESNIICYSLQILNGNLFTLYKKNDGWSLDITNQGTIVYVNYKKASSDKLYAGDIVYVLGFKMVIGDNYIAINNPNNLVSYNEQVLSKIDLQKVVKNSDNNITVEEEEIFYRSPRFIPTIEKKTIKIEAPPASQVQNLSPMALSLGPSVIMGMTSVMTSATTIITMEAARRTFWNVFPTVIMGASMIVTSVAFPFFTEKFNRKSFVKKEIERQEKYKKYLSDKQNEIFKLKEEQRKMLMSTYRSFEQLTDIINNKTIELWSKSPSNHDFLTSYIGVGNVAPNLNLDSPEKGFSLEDDNLKDLVQEIKENPNLLENVPIYYSFSKNFITGVTGESNLIYNFMQNVIFELVTLHGYDDVKFIFVGNELDEKKWSDLKWLPHFWDNNKKLRFFVSNTDDLAVVSEHINRLIEEEEIFETDKASENKVKRILKEKYIVLFTDKALFEQADFTKKVLNSDSYFGISLITLFGNYSNLPRECNSILDIRTSGSTLYTKNSNKLLNFASNCVKVGNYVEYYKKLFNIKLNVGSVLNVLPDSISFLDMYNVGKIEYLNILSRWKENDPTLSLKSPVGVNQYGDLFYIDLHEKYHGPHGLIAGGTGSGKSEFIITFILSLAINYHPDEVSFVLIDYKGGGLTGAFEIGDSGKKLPHLSGTITNLSGSSIKRCIVSIKSELQRRQKIFNEARKVSGEGTIDIYKYQKLRRQGIVKEAVPHLYIISDEFAELKTQQPEFMEELISTARIGRSLGVHLILATQKPAGVVDEQIWSNTKFRVCLKVQDKADSMDMIRRPDAAELVQTGRFYFQVGYNELFAMGQSAWSGAEYIPKEKASTSNDPTIKLINNIGRVQYEAKQKNDVVSDKRFSQQVVEIVKHLAEIAENEKIEQLSLWMEPLPSSILIDKLVKKYSYKVSEGELNPVIGEYDDPSMQSQHILTMPISLAGNCAIYGAVGSGKTTMLSTIVYSLINNVSAEHLNIYIIDFGTGFLKIFDRAPQVGDVMLQEDEEKINNLFKKIEKEIAIRKKLFSQYGGDISSYRKFSKKKISNILIIINNFVVFNENFELLSEKLKNLLRDGVKYGITFILTGTDSLSINFNFTQNIKLVYALQLNNPDEYVSILGNTDKLVPSAVPGRGLVKLDERIFEFQTALLEYSDKMMEKVINVCDKLNEKSPTFAESILTIPDKINYLYYKNIIRDINNVPFGMERENLVNVYLNFGKYPIQLISAEILKSTYSSIKELLKIFIKVPGTYPFVFDLANKLELKANDRLYVANDKNYSSRINYVYNEYNKRKSLLENSNGDVKVLEKSFNMVCVFNGITNIFESLSIDDKNKLEEILALDNTVYKIYIILLEEVNNLNEYNIERWYQKMISNSPVLWVGRGLAEQYAIKVNGNPDNEITNDFGYKIEDGAITQMKILEYENNSDEQN